VLCFEEDGKFLFLLGGFEGEFAAEFADAVDSHRLPFVRLKNEDIRSGRQGGELGRLADLPFSLLGGSTGNEISVNAGGHIIQYSRLLLSRQEFGRLEAMESEPTSRKKTLGEVLLARDLITPEQKERIQFEVLNTGKSEREIVAERGWVSAKSFAEARAEFLDVPFVSLAELAIPPEVITKIPEPTARNYKAVPFAEGAGELKVAMLDPLDLPTIELLERGSGMKVIPHLAEKDDLEAALERFYGEEKMDAEISEAVEAATPTTKIEEHIKEMEKAGEVFREAPVSRIVSLILEYAVKVGASDVHIEPLEEKTRVRFRVDGVLREKFPLPRKVHPSIVARIKILARLKLDERRRPQDGRFKVEVGGVRVDLRISVVPTIFGEKVVIRLLEERGDILSLEALGLSGISIKRIRDTLRQPNGIMLVTGPTGSGKTLTLASSISQINKVGINIITLEDPVEIRLRGVTQIQVNRDVDLTFSSGLRSILRQDPDVVMVGEIRDAETAELAVHAALTGHLVFSTLHTNSAAGALPRMMDMQVAPYLLVSTVNVIVAQRLVRTIHEDCKEGITAPPEVVEEMKAVLGPLFPQKAEGKGGEVTIYHGKGCEGCGGTGYKGRTGIFEALAASDNISRLVLEHQPTQAIEDQAIKEGMVTLKQDGFLKVLAGRTTVEEIMRVTREE